MTVKLTHPDKIFYAEDHIDKQDIYNYYEEFQALILPYITKRPLTLVRCPTDYHHCFYQKHPGEKGMPSAIHSIKIQEKHSVSDYMYIDNAQGLLELIQLGVLELHPWGSTIKAEDQPDILIFDLDPGPGVTWKKVVETAVLFRDQLADIDLKSYVKSTGGKGLHVVIPVVPEYSWEEAKQFCKSLCEYIATTDPSRYTTNMRKTERKGKIFLDYLRNQKGATAIAPYSTRARIHAPIATPVAWDELTNNIRDVQYTLKTIGKRLRQMKKDPWKDFFNSKQSLPLDKIK